MTSISIHQPAYLPWVAYFDKISRCDIFIYLDSVQYEKNSFINRNKIKTPKGTAWLTIPVSQRNHTSQNLSRTLIDEKSSWRRKHLASILLNYSKAPGFGSLYPSLSEVISLPISNLSDYLFEHLKYWCSQLNISTKIYRSSSLGLTSSKSDLVLDICKLYSASIYYSGPMGANYLSVDDFTRAGIRIDYQTRSFPHYQQQWGDFIPGLSIVDYLMNGGKSFDVV